MTTAITSKPIDNFKELLNEIINYINYKKHINYNVSNIFKQILNNDDNIKTVKKKLSKYKKKNKQIIKQIINELIFFHKYKCNYNNTIFIQSSDTHDRTIEVYRLCNINKKINMTQYYKWILDA